MMNNPKASFEPLFMNSQHSHRIHSLNSPRTFSTQYQTDASPYTPNTRLHTATNRHSKPAHSNEHRAVLPNPGKRYTLPDVCHDWQFRPSTTRNQSASNKFLTSTITSGFKSQKNRLSKRTKSSAGLNLPLNRILNEQTSARGQTLLTMANSSQLHKKYFQRANKRSLPNLMAEQELNPYAPNPQATLHELPATNKPSQARDAFLHSDSPRLDLPSDLPVDSHVTEPAELATRRKQHVPARFLKAHKPASHLYAAENFNLYEKLTNELVNEQSNQQTDRTGNIVQSFRQRLNKDFKLRFDLGAQDKMDASVEASLANISEDEVMPTLPDPLLLRSMNKKATMKTIKSLNSTSLSDLKQSMVNIDKREMRPAVVGLPEQACQATDQVIKLRNRIKAKKMTVKMTGAPKKHEVQLPKKKLLHKAADAQKKTEEDSLLKVIEDQLENDRIAPPTNLFGAHENTMANLMKKNPRLFGMQKIDFKRIRMKLLNVLKCLKLLRINPKEVCLLCSTLF